MASTPRGFTVVVKFRKMDNLNKTTALAEAPSNGTLGEPCAFKVDGQRFETSSRTIKFNCDSKYRVHINVNPPLRLDWLRLAGSDCPLHVSTSICGSASPMTLGKASKQEDSNKAASQYWTEWDTAGISHTQAGKRDAINFALQGPDVSLSKAVQCKFYARTDSHAGWGTALDAIVYKCVADSQGCLVVTDEEFK